MTLYLKEELFYTAIMAAYKNVLVSEKTYVLLKKHAFSLHLEKKIKRPQIVPTLEYIVKHFGVKESDEDKGRYEKELLKIKEDKRLSYYELRERGMFYCKGCHNIAKLRGDEYGESYCDFCCRQLYMLEDETNRLFHAELMKEIRKAANIARDTTMIKMNTHILKIKLPIYLNSIEHKKDRFHKHFRNRVKNQVVNKSDVQFRVEKIS